MIISTSSPAIRSAVVVAVLTLILAGCISTEESRREHQRTFGTALSRAEVPFTAPIGSKLDSMRVDDSAKVVRVYLSKEFAGQPIREDVVDRVISGVRNHFGDDYAEYRYDVRSLGVPLNELIPNAYRSRQLPIDSSRIARYHAPHPEPVVLNTSLPAYPSRGLENRNILLWHSHGWYYNATERRWEWQRPRLFQSVEDLGPLSFTLPYIVPMLENAGARVFLPRERDIQTHEVIIDNDSVPAGSSEKILPRADAWRTLPAGFRPARSYPANVNPFNLGTSRWTHTDTQGSGSIRWTPDIPASGTYAVSITWQSSDSSTHDARYTVYHAGGATTFRVDQHVGGGTWHYLGSFAFRKGAHPDSGSVLLTTAGSIPGFRLSADAVRFGGGFGLVEREGSTSGRPRFTEGARYWLQFAGMPDTLVYNLNGNANDYKDDYQSRAEYGNYLYGAPYGPNRNRNARGLGIPIDLSLAFHTDAGTTRNDTTVGTLLIYSVEGYDSTRVFPDGVSRLANRDLADLMQTQIVDDIRRLHDPAWRRRDLRNADYSEAVRPNFPGVLLELLSHQNFLDMQFMLDPRFRFDVSRAIYKSMLRFLANPAGPAPIVQPLPVDHLAAEFTPTGGVLVRWQPVRDQLEPTAVPDRYIVYVRVGDGGFDNGHLVEFPSWTLAELRPGVITSFKVCAVNDGGQSMPSEILSVCRVPGDDAPVLVVNGFDRVAAPATVNTPAFAGFLNGADGGIADRVDYNFTGVQHDFSPSSVFRSNDDPGFGASYADDETHIVAGNTFDFPAVHGAALRAAGRSFVSCSDEAVTDSLVQLQRYRMVDLILGEEHATPRVRPLLDSLYGVRYAAFPLPLRSAVTRYLSTGGRLIVSGSTWADDLWATPKGDSSGIRFSRDVLKTVLVANHACLNGEVSATDTSFLPAGTTVRFATTLNDSMYAVGSPEGIGPVRGGRTLMRYPENGISAAVGFTGEGNLVLFGFPLETLMKLSDRTALMKAALRYLER
jgi:hypothetical protein